MQDMLDFVHASNVRRFLQDLATELDPVQRSTMQRLLVEEEDKLGRTVEQLDNAARWIEDGKERITKVRHAASWSEFSEEHRRRAGDLLITLQHTQSLLEDFHRRIARELNKIDAVGF